MQVKSLIQPVARSSRILMTTFLVLLVVAFVQTVIMEIIPLLWTRYPAPAAPAPTGEKTDEDADNPEDIFTRARSSCRTARCTWSQRRRPEASGSPDSRMTHRPRSSKSMTSTMFGSGRDRRLRVALSAPLVGPEHPTRQFHATQHESGPTDRPRRFQDATDTRRDRRQTHGGVALRCMGRLLCRL